MSRDIYLVTGAAGHLGAFVVRELLSRGNQVRALVLPNETCPGFIDENRDLLKEYTGNVCDPASLEPLFGGEVPGGLIVIHCAGIITISKKWNQAVYDVNVGGTANIIEMCRRHAVKRLVYVSSVHAIARLPAGQVMAEVDVFDPDALQGCYDKTKAAATRLVLDVAKEGLDAVVVHPSGIIGPHGLPTGNMTQMITRFLHGKLPAAVHGGFDFVDVRDVAAGITAAAKKGKSGECYILSNRFIEVKEMLDILAAASGRKPLKIYLPLWLAKAFAPLMETYYKLSKKTPLFTSYSLETLSENAVFSHGKASRDLGYAPRDLKETLRDMAAWIKSADGCGKRG